MTKVNTMNKQDITQRFFDAVFENLRSDVYEQVKHLRLYGADEGVFTDEELEFIEENNLDEITDYAVTDALDYVTECADDEFEFVEHAFEHFAEEEANAQ